MTIKKHQAGLGKAAKRLLHIVSTGMLVYLLVMPSAKAVTIEYAVQDLGGGSWEYSYFLSGITFSQYQGFQIDFDYNFYSTLDPFPYAPNADWSPITFDPDPGLPANGIYDAIALVSNPSLADPFVVTFNWMGAGQPGAQAFSIYGCEDDFCSTGILFGQAGMTVARNSDGGGGPTPTPVPEPLMVLLMGLGLLGMSVARRRI